MNTETIPLIGDSITVENGRANFGAVLSRLERVSVRPCHECGNEFEAVGLVAICDACALKRDNPEPPKYSLNESWPKLQADKIGELHGAGLAMAEKLAPRMHGNRLLVLAGDRGRGKTQIAVYCAWRRGQDGHRTGLYSRAYDLCESIIGFDRESKLDRWQKTPFLVIDECHRLEAKHLVTLESIVDDRYGNKRPTILIGNWTTKEGIQRGEVVDGETLFGLGSSLVSRMNEHTANRTGGVVWCKWGSYRV